LIRKAALLFANPFLFAPIGEDQRILTSIVPTSRGNIRACLLIGSAAVSNVRRIQRYLQAKSKAEIAQQVAPGAEKCTQEQAGGSFLAFVKTTLAALSCLARPNLYAMGC